MGLTVESHHLIPVRIQKARNSPQRHEDTKKMNKKTEGTKFQRKTLRRALYQRIGGRFKAAHASRLSVQLCVSFAFLCGLVVPSFWSQLGITPTSHRAGCRSGMGSRISEPLNQREFTRF
jgi:hypothetical protein